MFSALANSRGLLELTFRGTSIGSENWVVLCDSLPSRPTLTSLDLRNTAPMTQTRHGRVEYPDEQDTRASRNDGWKERNSFAPS
jgi:hypothetical protein